jgi:hypothetical protein
MMDLSVGAGVAVDGVEWTVELFEPHCGRVLLVGTDGTRLPTTVRLQRHGGYRARWPRAACIRTVIACSGPRPDRGIE